MSQTYRNRLFEQAEAVALGKELDRLTARNFAAKHLRYAALQLLEGDDSGPSDPVAERGIYTVAYGTDRAQWEAWGDSVDWWGDGHPETCATRIRVIVRDGSPIRPSACKLMEALGATFVLHKPAQDSSKPPFSGGSNAYHYLHDDHDPVVEEYCEWLRNRHYAKARKEIGIEIE